MTHSVHQSTTAVTLLREQLTQGALARLRVSSNSMAPLLERGDVVLVEGVEPGGLHRGDLLVVGHGGSLVVHRLVAADRNGLWTKGDNVTYPDPVVGWHDVLGRVVSVEKGCMRLEMSGRRWAVANRLLGYSGWLEVQILAAARVVWRRAGGGRASRWSRRLAAWATAPFRGLTRLLLK